MAVALHPVGYTDTGVPELVNRAMALVPPDTHEEGLLLSQYGLNLGQNQDDYDGAQEALGRALTIAVREEDVDLQMWTLARAGHIGMTYLRSQECLEKNGQVVELKTKVDNPNAEGFARACLFQTLVTRGRSCQCGRRGLALVQFLAREIGGSKLLVIGTYRDAELSRQHPLSKTLGALAREHLYQRIPLRGLDLAALELLIQDTAGTVSSPNLTHNFR